MANQNLRKSHFSLGGGWRGSSLNDKLNGGSLLEGAFGGKSCFNGKGTHGQGK